MAAALTERLLAGQALDAADRQALLRTALRLRRTAHAAVVPALLAGRHVAIACTAGDTPAQAVFERAARLLGARVSRIAPDLLFDASDATTAPATRLLARLYDAVDCHAGGTERALALHRQSGVPVYLGLGGAAHPIRALLGELGPIDDADALLCLVQAVLIETLA